MKPDAISITAEASANVAPITALCFLDPEVILVGEGSFLKSFHIPSQKCIFSRRMFDKDRIHGIRRVSDDGLVIWGGKNVLATSLSDLSKTTSRIRSEDWIFAATVTDSGVLAFITARNELFVVEHSNGDFSDSGVRKLGTLSEERCTLYTAKIEHYPKENRFLVAAGTVFGEIMVWSASFPGDTDCVQLHYRLEGHAGAVFDLDFTPSLNGRRFLGSCSNDRTIRVWDISKADVGDSKTRDVSRPVKDSLATGWGHYARPWRLKLIYANESDRLTVVSAAEDLKANVWSFYKQAGEWALRLDGSHQLHSGKSIWSIDVLTRCNLLATGGADGQVALTDISAKQAPLQMHISALLDKFGLPQTLSQAEAPVSKAVLNIKKNFAQYCVVDSHRLVFTTSFGHIFLHSILDNKWKLLGTRPDLRNFSVLTAWQKTNIVAVGDVHNKVSLLDISDPDNALLEWTEPNFKRFGEFYAGRIEKENCLVLVITSASGNGITVSCISKSSGIWSQRAIIVPVPEDIALVTAAFFDGATGLLFVGSNKGEILTFSLDVKTSSAHLLHRGGVLSSRAIISFIGNYWSPQLLDTMIFVGNRNGKYAVVHFDANNNRLHELRSSQPPDCRIVGGSYQNSAGDLFVYGFRGKHFFVRDETNSMEVFEEECGGTHRCWALCPPGSDDGGYFVWTKASTLGLVYPLPNNRRIVKTGLHGREIKSLAVHGTRIATGAEDTRICFSRYDTEQNNLHYDAFAKLHSSGVHSLKFSGCGGFLFSSGGVEEIYVWRMSKLGTTFECSAPPTSKNPDLRVESLDICSLAVGEEKEQAFLVAAVYSDSTIRIMAYGPQTKTFVNVFTIPHSTPPVCLTQARLVVEGEGLFLFTGGTNGIVAAWDLSELWAETLVTHGVLHADSWDALQRLQGNGDDPRKVEPSWSLRLHQSSIKCLEILQDGTSHTKLTIATGGDDGALACTKLCTKTWTCNYSREENVHAAAVGALAVLGYGGYSEGLQLVSFGVDRKVIAWSVESKNEPSFRELGCWKSGVHDISSASLISRDEVGPAMIIVAGVGVEIWKFPAKQIAG